MRQLEMDNILLKNNTQLAYTWEYVDMIFKNQISINFAKFKKFFDSIDKFNCKW